MIVFDIETAALPAEEIRGLMPDFSAPANWKDKDKIEGEIARQQVLWFEQAALSPITGNILVIGLVQGDETLFIDGEPPRNEGDMIAEFFDYWRSVNKPRFVGFCVKNFDLPFLLRRAWKHGVEVPADLRQGRYFSDRIIDLQETWCCGLNPKEERISLDRLAKYLGLGAKTGSGADFAKLWSLDRPAAYRYLKNDLELTKAIAKKLGVWG